MKTTLPTNAATPLERLLRRAVAQSARSNDAKPSFRAELENAPAAAKDTPVTAARQSGANAVAAALANARTAATASPVVRRADAAPARSEMNRGGNSGGSNAPAPTAASANALAAGAAPISSSPRAVVPATASAAPAGGNIASAAPAASVPAASAKPRAETASSTDSTGSSPAPTTPQVPDVAQQIQSALMGGYYAGSNNTNFSYQTGIPVGGSISLNDAAAQLSDLQDAYFTSVRAGDVTGAHSAIDQMNSVRSAIGLNAYWSPLSDFQILQHAGGEVGDAARAYAENHAGELAINQFVNTGSGRLMNGGGGTLVSYTGAVIQPEVNLAHRG